MSNALKYAGHVSDARIVVSGSQDETGSRIAVSDNGPGVALSQRDAIFGLLVRGHDIAEGTVEGLGIGLATCQRIIQAHGGQLGVTGATMGGAEFWFELPLPREGALPGRLPALALAQ